MKKKVIIALSILLIGSVFIYNDHATSSNSDIASRKLRVNTEESNNLDTTRANNTEAFYLDYEESLEAVKNNADLIVVGKVIEQSEYGEIGVKNTIMVTNTIKGEAVDEIYVLKSGPLNDEDYILKEGKEYILLLGDQSKSGENTYFIKGGEQGCFLINDGVLYAKDAVMDKELKNMIENSGENKSTKAGTDQVKAMLDYLSN